MTHREIHFAWIRGDRELREWLGRGVYPKKIHLKSKVRIDRRSDQGQAAASQSWLAHAALPKNLQFLAHHRN